MEFRAFFLYFVLLLLKLGVTTDRMLRAEGGKGSGINNSLSEFVCCGGRELNWTGLFVCEAGRGEAWDEVRVNT
jgi:hypothetical protein